MEKTRFSERLLQELGGHLADRAFGAVPRTQRAFVAGPEDPASCQACVVCALVRLVVDPAAMNSAVADASAVATDRLFLRPRLAAGVPSARPAWNRAMRTTCGRGTRLSRSGGYPPGPEALRRRLAPVVRLAYRAMERITRK